MNRLTNHLGALSLALLAGSVQATPISDLFAGDTIESGDKLFADWAIINQVDPDAGEMDLEAVDVTAVGDGSAGNEYGLQFASGAQWAAMGDDFLDLYFGYTVEVLDPLKKIIGASMTGTFDVQGDDSPYALVEKFIYNAAGEELAFMEVVDDPFLGDLILEDSAAFSGQSKIWVEDNIFVDGFGGSAELLSFTQRFMQASSDPEPVPNPATLALFGLGLAGLGWSRRKKA